MEPENGGGAGDAANQHFRSPRAVVDNALQKVKSQLTGRPEYATTIGGNDDDHHHQLQEQHSSLQLEEVDIDVEKGTAPSSFLNRNPLFGPAQTHDQHEQQGGAVASLVAGTSSTRKADWSEEERSEGGESSSSKRSAASSVMGKCVPPCCKRHAFKIVLVAFAIFIISLAVAFGLH